MARTILKGAAVLAAVPTLMGVLGGAAQASPSAGEAFTPADVTSFDCPSGNICFYSGRDGSGARCTWSVADPDWWGGDIVCSWADDTPVASVYNHGTDGRFTGVAFYGGANYQDRKGCTRQGQAGNLRGDYKVRSHRWITTSCG